MIRQTYIADLKNIPRDTVRIRVAHPSPLAPSKELLKDWKDGKITWIQYKQRYITQIQNNHDALQLLEHIRRQARYKDVYLYCYEKRPPCHRFILVELLKNDATP